MDSRKLVNGKIGRRSLLGGIAVVGGSLALGEWGRRAWQPAYGGEPPTNWTANSALLHEKQAQGDFLGAADHAGHLADEAMSRASRVLESWLALRPDFRGMLPRKLEDSHRWNYKDCAADNFCHLAIAASLIQPQRKAELVELLEIERRFDDGLPQSVNLRTGKIADETLDNRMFGAVEYAKDELLPILERLGATEWWPRLHGLVDTIIATSPVNTAYGKIPSAGAEKNGEFLQVLSRLYQKSGDPRLLAAGRSIADAYVFEVLPHEGKVIPSDQWDFAARAPLIPGFELRDHGNEILAGLCEWMVAEQVAPDSRAQTYRPAVRKMLDAVMQAGLDGDGLWTDYIGTRPEGKKHYPNDNWGYLTSAYTAFALASETDPDRRSAYLAQMQQVVERTIAKGSQYWSGLAMDFFADSVESGLYLLPHSQVKGLEEWIDRQAGHLMSFQRPDGFSIGTYLDGNFVRSSLLHASYRTLGTIPDPWRPGLRLGAIRAGDTCHFCLSSETPWTGVLRFDTPRHKEILNLKLDYPRLNSWTEWYPVSRERSYRLTMLKDGKQTGEKTIAGAELVAGLPLSYESGRLQMTVEAV